MAAPISEGSKTPYVFLGRSGLKVSNICLGTMTFGESQLGRPGQCSEDISHQIINRYVEWGGNFLDTADVYGIGLSESIIGKWLETQPRDKFVIATKCRNNMGTKENINNVGSSRRHITESIDRSLQRLHTDFVDLYQTHVFDEATPVEETLRTLNDLVRVGKIHYIGVSNVTGWQLHQLVSTINKLGLNPIISLQQQYSLASRDSEVEPFQVCKFEGIGVLPWSPLKAGLLTGKVKRGVKPTEGRIGWVAENESRAMQSSPSWKTFDDQTFDIIETAEAIAKKHGRTVPQVAIRWLLQREIVSSVIIGARTLAQLDDNMGANGWSLTREEMQQLDEVSAVSHPYPYDYISRLNTDRVNKFHGDFHISGDHRLREMSSNIPDDRKTPYNFLGRSGIKVSNICLGSVTFGKDMFGFPGQSDEDMSHKLLNRFSEWGGNFLDTADTYGFGHSETIIGKWIEKQPRDRYVIATKCRFNMGTEQNINNVGASRRHVTASVDRSLKCLHTHYIDLFQIHQWDEGTPLEETLRTLDDLVRVGKIRYAGYSNVTGWQMQKLVDATDKLGLNPIVSLQQQYSLLSRDSENEAFQVCKQAGVAILPWSPLKGGILTGKVKRGVKPVEGRIGWAAENMSRNMEISPHFSTYDNKTFNIVDTVQAIAKKRGRTMPQVAIRWLLQKNGVTSVVIGARTLSQLDDNMGAAIGWSLTQEEMKELDDVSSSPLVYPHNMMVWLNSDRINPHLGDAYIRSVSI